MLNFAFLWHMESWLQKTFFLLLAIAPARQSWQSTGWRGKGTFAGDQQPLHQCCLRFHRQTILHTHHAPCHNW